MTPTVALPPYANAPFLARAEISYSKARAITRVATPENEGRLLHMAKNATAAQLDRICRGVEQVMSVGKPDHARWLRVEPCSGLDEALDPNAVNQSNVPSPFQA